MLVKITYSAQNSARNSAWCPRKFSSLQAVCIFLKMEVGSLGLTPDSLCKAKTLHHFIISVETVNFWLWPYKKRNSQQIYIQFFVLMLYISLEVLIFRYSAQILVENALFCRQNARPKNRLFCSKFCRQNLSKPTKDPLTPFNSHPPHHHPSVPEGRSHVADPAVVVWLEPGFAQDCWHPFSRLFPKI